MRHIVAALLALFAATAQAVCLPAADGTSVISTSRATPAIWENNAAGVAVAWYCNDGFQWTQYLYVMRWDAATPAILSALGGIAQAVDKVAAIDAVAAAYATTPLGDPSLQEVVQPGWARMLAARPAAPIYIVRLNGTTPTRAAYAILNGQLVIVALKRAPVGEVCDCKTRLIQAGNPYCLVPSIAPAVAFCAVVK